MSDFRDNYPKAHVLKRDPYLKAQSKIGQDIGLQFTLFTGYMSVWLSVDQAEALAQQILADCQEVRRASQPEQG